MLKSLGLSIFNKRRGDNLGAKTLAQATGYWVASDYSTSPIRHIPNRNTTIGVENQIVPISHSVFEYKVTTDLQWTATPSPQVVVQDDYADGPHAWDSGKLRASRLYIPAANSAAGVLQKDFLRHSTSAEYITVSVWLRSNTGLNQVAKISPAGGTWFQTVTVTTEWQRFTATSAATTVANPNPRITADGTNALDVSIVDFKAWRGATAGTDLEPAGHMILGDRNNTTLPSASGGILSLQSANGQYGIAAWPGFGSWAKGTFLVLARRTLTGTADVSEEFIGSVKTRTDIQFLRDFSAASQGAGMPHIQVGGTTSLDAWANYVTPYGKGWHVIATHNDGPQATGVNQPAGIWWDDVQLWSDRTQIGAVSYNVRHLSFGGYSAARKLGYEIAAAAFFQGRVLTPAEIRAAGDEMRRVAALSGISATKWLHHVKSEGHSFTTSSYSYPKVNATAGYTPVAVSSQYGGPGSSLATMSARASALDAMIPKGVTGSRFVLTVDIGANDSIDATWAGSLADYCDARRAAGWKVVIGTILSRKDAFGEGLSPTFNTRRATVNAIIRTWVGVHVDAIADVAADGTMGTDAVADNATYYSTDKIHPTAAGHAILAPIWKAAVNSVLA